MTHTVESLIAFETRVGEAFEAKQIKGPVHLCSRGQAQPLINYFAKYFTPGDWVCSNWRSHWHCLLAGMPEDELFAEILAGRSMYVNSAKYRIICSAIVGGTLPIAVGLAMGIKRWGDRKGKVHCFVGDMTATTGLCFEATHYATGFYLPLHVVVEDNGYSTNARTQEVWGRPLRYTFQHYKYERDWPHTGTGVYVQF